MCLYEEGTARRHRTRRVNNLPAYEGIALPPTMARNDTILFVHN